MSLVATRYTVPFTPLMERIEKEAPELSSALVTLQVVIGKDEFEKYINSLLSVRKVNDQVLMITKKEMYRSIIMSRFLPAIKESFAVNFVRVVSQ
ncbi:hypothetical protein [Pelosinus sp. sgz500959]|uniref:hypothetical protein n=1 Tax=Pelosinus sp. sgz500959 TaxID=3242472 RepID=UPI00366F2851